MRILSGFKRYNLLRILAPGFCGIFLGIKHELFDIQMPEKILLVILS